MNDDQHERLIDQADRFRDERKDRELEEAFSTGIKNGVAKYITYISKDRVVNDGHVILRRLWTTYGRSNVDAELEKQFKEQDQ